MKNPSKNEPGLPGLDHMLKQPKLLRLRKKYSKAIEAQSRLSQQLAEKMVGHDHLISEYQEKLTKEVAAKASLFIAKLGKKLKPLQLRKRKAESAASKIAVEYGVLDPTGVADMMMSVMSQSQPSTPSDNAPTTITPAAE